MLVPLSVLSLPRSDSRYALILLFCGGLGFVFTLSQGFILGLHGWGGVFLEEVFGPTEQRQIGMGYGALLVCCGFMFMFTQGLAARGAIKGDEFVCGSIGFCVVLVTFFVFFPVGRILINALQDDEGNYVFSLFLEKIISPSIWFGLFK